MVWFLPKILNLLFNIVDVKTKLSCDFVFKRSLVFLDCICASIMRCYLKVKRSESVTESNARFVFGINIVAMAGYVVEFGINIIAVGRKLPRTRML